MTKRVGGQLILSYLGVLALKASIDAAKEGMEAGRFSCVSILIPSHELAQVNGKPFEIGGTVIQTIPDIAGRDIRTATSDPDCEED